MPTVGAVALLYSFRYAAAAPMLLAVILNSVPAELLTNTGLVVAALLVFSTVGVVFVAVTVPLTGCVPVI